MKKSIITAILLACTTIAASAQTSDLHDSVMERICSYVEALRSDPDGYEVVRAKMAEDMKWTMMSEFADSCSTPEALCGLRDRVRRTGINDIALQAEHMRGTVAKSAELFCNGNDPKYNYSLYEVKVKPGCHVRSRLSHRKGQQYFVVIPYEDGISAEIICKGSSIPYSIMKDGSMAFVVEKSLNEDDIIEISISNNTDSSRSAVVINHNSHRQ